jgi:parallel beta-helix repeat protein
MDWMLFMRKVLLLTAIFFILSLSSVYAVSCGDTITTDTILDTDLICSGDGLQIGASNIVLDCNGHTIRGLGTGYTNGIYTWGIIGYPKTNVTIKNCYITNFTYGINLGVYNNSKIINNKVFNNTWYGLTLNYFTYSVIEDNIAYNQKAGFAFSDSSYNIIKNNEAFNNYDYYGGFYLNDCGYNNITNNLVHDNNRGFYIGYGNSYNTFSNNKVYDNSIGGITLYWSDFNTIKNNLVYNQIGAGIFLQGSDNNIISDNTVYNNSVIYWNAGVQLYQSTYNLIYHNNIINNKYQAWDRAGLDGTETDNKWDNGYPSGGNYWGGTCTDINKGPSQNETGSDGICDTPYVISYFGTETKYDRYPFAQMNGWDLDGDGVLYYEDKCQNTIGEQLIYGCSCKQILDLKPGEDSGECSKGIIEVFTKAIGWAKDLFG